MANWHYTKPQGEYDYPNAVSGASPQTFTPTSVVATWVVAAATLVSVVTLQATPAIANWMVPAATLVPGQATLAATPAIATWTVPAPTLVLGQATLAATPAVATWTVPAATLLQLTTMVATPAVATWTVPAPTLVPGIATLVATPAIATWTVPAPTLVATVTIAATPAIATWTVPTPVVHLKIPVTPVIATWTVPAATLLPGSVTLAATSVTSTWTVPAPTLVATVTLAATPAIATWTVPTPVVHIKIVVTPVVATWTVPAPTLVPGSVTLAATPAIATWTVPNATILIVTTMVATPAVSTWTVPAPVVHLKIPVTPVIATWTIPAPTLVPSVTLAATPAIATWVVPNATLGRTIAATPAVSTWVVPTPTLNVKLLATPVVSTWVVPAATITQGQIFTPTPVVVTWVVKDAKLASLFPSTGVIVATVTYDTPVTRTVIVTGSSWYAALIKSREPWSYWRFEETVVALAGTGPIFDEMGNSLIGKWFFPIQFQQAGLVSQSASARLSPSAHFFNLGVPPIDVAMSFEIWCQPDAIGALQALMADNSGVALYINADGRFSWMISEGDNEEGEHIYTPVISSIVAVAGQKYHVVGVWTSVGRQLYVNGVLEASDTVAAPWPGLGQWWIGGRRPGFEMFNGLLDEAVIYAKALTAGQVLEDYQAGIATPPSADVRDIVITTLVLRTVKFRDTTVDVEGDIDMTRILYTQSSDVGNIGAAETPLFSYTVQPNVLNANGQQLIVRIVGYGLVPPGGIDKWQRYRLVVNGVDVSQHPSPIQGGYGPWELILQIVRASPSAGRTYATFSQPFGQVQSLNDILNNGTLVDAALDFTIATTIEFFATYEGVQSDQIVATFGSVEWKDKPAV